MFYFCLIFMLSCLLFVVLGVLDMFHVLVMFHFHVKFNCNSQSCSSYVSSSCWFPCFILCIMFSSFNINACLNIMFSALVLKTVLILMFRSILFKMVLFFFIAGALVDDRK